MKWLSHKCTCIVDFFHIFWNSLSVHFFNSLKKLLKGWNDIVSYFIQWNSLSPEILILRKYGLKVKFIILYCHFFHRPFQETLIIMRRRPTSLKRSFRHNTSSSNLWPSVGGSPLDWMYWSVSMVGNFQHILSSHCVHYKPIFSLLKHINQSWQVLSLSIKESNIYDAQKLSIIWTYMYWHIILDVYLDLDNSCINWFIKTIFSWQWGKSARYDEVEKILWYFYW